ncbi:MAG: diguanylate cyclase [Rhodoferax sp.]
MVMEDHSFLSAIVDSLPQQLAVIDATGRIHLVNQAWVDFGVDNACALSVEWSGVNYLQVCEAAASDGDSFGLLAAAGIKKILKDKAGEFSLEYPCHSASAERWFLMSAKHFPFQGQDFCLITHHDITKRTIAEQLVQRLSRLDGLTGIPNRRSFDEFIAAEWSRCARQQQPLTVVMLDIDHFKHLNDHYDHQAGDECLIQIAAILDSQPKRPGDMCARYGGEEFVYVLGNTTCERAQVVVQQLFAEIEKLGFPNAHAPTKGLVTVSAGGATVFPTPEGTVQELIGMADKQLYRAKSEGRGRFVWQAD